DLLRDQRPDRRRELRKYSFHAFVLVAVLPVLVLSTIAGELFSTRQETDGKARLHEAANAISDHLEDYLAAHAHSLEVLAAMVTELGDDPVRRAPVLAQYTKTYHELARISVDDLTGHVVQAAPPVTADEAAAAIGGPECFEEAIRTRRV